MTKYRPLLEFCKRNVGRVKLHSGFLPSPFAKQATSKIKFDKALKEAKQRKYIGEDMNLEWATSSFGVQEGEEANDN